MSRLTDLGCFCISAFTSKLGLQAFGQNSNKTTLGITVLSIIILDWKYFPTLFCALHDMKEKFFSLSNYSTTFTVLLSLTKTTYKT